MATGDTMTFVINDSSTGGNNPQVQVTITENADGTLTFQIVQLGGVGAYLGDLQGFFFDFPEGHEGLIGSLDATGQSGNGGAYTQDNDLVQGNDSVSNLGGGVNMNGLLGGDGGYDAGIKIGTSGIGSDDVRSFEFTLSSSSHDLTLADFANVTFGVRITSVGQDVNGDGTIDTARNGSSKIGETTFDPDFSVVNDDSGCVDEGTSLNGNVLDNDDGSTAGDGVLPANLIVKSVKVDANDDGDFDDPGEIFAFTGSATSHSWNLGDTGAVLTMNADGSYTVDASGSDLDEGEHIDFNIEYTAQKTFFETNGSVAGSSTKTAGLTVEICGTDDGGGGGGGDDPPDPSIAKSPGFWSTHNGDGSPPPDTVSEWDGVANGQSFEAFFGVVGPYAGQWDIVAPINGSSGLVNDITFAQAVTLANGGGSENLLAKEAVTAVLNFNEDDLAGVHDSFIEWYVWERAHYDDTHAGAPEADLSGLTDAQIMADLLQQVHDAYTYNGGLNASSNDTYTIVELADLLKATHEL